MSVDKKAIPATSSRTPGLVIIFLMGAFGVMGGALIAPALPSLIPPFDVSEDRVGLVLSVYTLSAALALPFIGFLLDRLGRKRVALGCLLIDGIFGIGCIFAPSFGVLLLFRFFQGMGIAGLIPVAMTVLSDWFSDRAQRIKMMGYLSGTISASAVLIPLLGGILAAQDWRYPFLVYGFSVLLAALFLLFIGETRSSKAESDRISDEIRRYVRGLGQAIRIKRVQETFAHSFVIYFLLYTMVSFLPLFLSSVHGLGAFPAGAALAVQATFSVVVATRADWVDARWRWGRKLSTGFALVGVALLTLPFWGELSGVVISLFLFGVGMGLIQPAIYHEATAAPPPALAGSVVALFNTMKYIGMSTAPFALGLLRVFYPLSTVFWVAAGVSLTWLALFNGLTRRRPPSEPSLKS